MQKTKISIFTISLATGGAEKVISLLLKHLAKDFDVTLVLISNNIHFEIPNNVKIVTFFDSNILSNTSGLKKAIIGLKSIFKYRALVKKEKNKISLSFLALPNIINSIIAISNPKITTIISERCYPSKMYSINKSSLLIAKALYPIFYNRNSLLFSNSIHINKDLQKNFRVNLPMKVIYNPIEIENNKPYNKNYFEGELFKIINVGSNTPAKNQKLILKAISNLNSNFELTILGKGILADSLKNYAKEKEITKKVIFAGNVFNVNDYLLQNDCFVLSSNTEGFPNVLLEGMAIGLPVISTNCMSGPLEILNNNVDVSIDKGDFFCAKYGLLINTNDDVALVKAIMFLKSNPIERKKYSDLSYDRAKDFSVSNIYQQVKEILTTNYN
jgi:glycosyltransferase involved in cell wall biosynthesis